MAEETKTIDEAMDDLEVSMNLDAEKEIQRRSHTTIRLSKPKEYMGKTYEELVLAFDELTGRDMEAIDDELGAMGLVIANPNISHKYHRLLAARAAGVPSDMIEVLPLRDYQRITQAARYFLLATA